MRNNFELKRTKKENPKRRNLFFEAVKEQELKGHDVRFTTYLFGKKDVIVSQQLPYLKKPSKLLVNESKSKKNENQFNYQYDDFEIMR